MTPKEWRFFHEVMERTAAGAYMLGVQDVRDGKPVKETSSFRLTGAQKLRLDTELKKHLEGR